MSSLVAGLIAGMSIGGITRGWRRFGSVHRLGANILVIR
jgi:hypothetical protein